MDFVNPLDILNMQDITLGSLRMERKRLLSLTELSNDGMLDVGGGKFLSKSDIIKLCDSLENELTISFYDIIKKHTLLGDFLRDGDLHFFYKYHTMPEMQMPGFLKFVYPYFLYQFQRKIVELYDQSSANYMKFNEDFGKMCDFTLPFSNAENKAYFRILHSRLSRSADDIDYASQSYKGSGSALFDSVLKAVKPDILNRLPAEFDPEKARIGDRLYRLCVGLYHKKILHAVNLDILRMAQKVDWPGQLNENFRKLHMAQQVLNVALGDRVNGEQGEGSHFLQTLKYTVVILLITFGIAIYFQQINHKNYANGSYGNSGGTNYQPGEEYYKPPSNYQGNLEEHPFTKMPYDHAANPFVGLSKKKALELYNRKLLDIALKSGKAGQREGGALLSSHDLVKFYYLRAKLGAKATITTTDMEQSIEYWQAQGPQE